MSQARKMSGTFTIGGEHIQGELILDGEDTKLNLISRNKIPYNLEPHSIFGETLDHKKISLYECVGYATWAEGTYPNPVYRREVFPHYTAIGSQHIDWNEETFRSISFKTTDLGLIFSERGTFGSTWIEPKKLRELLDEKNDTDHKDVGDTPLIFYYSGSRSLKPTSLNMGDLSTTLVFNANTDDATGIRCDADRVATLTCNKPKSIDQLLTDADSILDFLAVIAGRPQVITDIIVSAAVDNTLTTQTDKVYVYWHLAPAKTSATKPNRRYVPLTPDMDEDEFHRVFVNWTNKHHEWSVARKRILRWQASCHHYDENRLIAAVNAFDILPDKIYPKVGTLSKEAEAKKADCKEIIKKLPHGNERSQILNTLKFWGSQLRDKILERSNIIKIQLNAHLPQLDELLIIGLKARNFYVHGTDYGHQHYEDLTIFLTNTMEFVFLASDLVECGWNLAKWADGEPSSGHPMASYLYSYKSDIIKFNSAKARASEKTRHSEEP